MPLPVKKRIMLASVLKPTDDTRMYEKMALSLHGVNPGTITVVGHGHAGREVPGIRIYALGRFARISAGRLLAPLKVLLISFQVKPEIVIVNTHELLIVGLLNRILFGAQIWYDVQENYYRNIRYGGVFPAGVRTVLALFVRAKERALAPFYSGFFLAERGYLQEMNFFGTRAIVLENKVLRAHCVAANRGPVFTFLFSGTLAPATGVFEAIRLVKDIHATGAQVRLRIIGYSAQPGVRAALRDACRNAPFITLEGVDALVPHPRIMEAIALSNAGIIAYPPSPHTMHAVPTKLYEYLGCQLPMVCIQHPVWSSLIEQWRAGISIDFSSYQAGQVWRHITSPGFYPAPPQYIFWEDEALLLFQALLAEA